MSSQIISLELIVMFFEIVPQRVEVGRTSTPMENKKDTVLFRYFLASLFVQALGRWMEFPYVAPIGSAYSRRRAVKVE